MKKTKGISKGKKKKVWYSLVSPKMFGEKVIFEVAANDKSRLNNRIVEVSLSELTGNFKHYHTNVKLRITGFDENKAKTEYIGQRLLDDKIARFINRWRSRIDSLDVIETTDGKKIRIKSIMVTGRRVKTTVKDMIRMSASEKIKKYFEGKTLEQIVNDIISGKVQRVISGECGKIYPLRFAEVRKTEVKL